jgi:acetoin utilization protein AcuB
MRMRDIMSSDVETITAQESLSAARQRMSLRRIHHLVVVDRGVVVGIVSSRDLKGARGDSSVGELMSENPVTVDPEVTVRKAANLLRGHIIGCLPVLDGKKLVGMVTISDLLTLLGSGAERPVERAKRWTLKHRGPRAVQQKRAARRANA